MTLLLVFIHVTALLVWIGALAAIGVVATTGAMGNAGVEERTRGTLARAIYQKLAVPGFVVAFLAGLARLLMGWSDGYAKMPWMHAKLILAVVVIALHHVVGARTRKMANDGAPPGPIATLTAIALIAAAGAVFLVVVRPF